MSAILQLALDRNEEWVTSWKALRADVLSGVDGLDNDQVNTVLGLIDYHEPSTAEGPVPLWKKLVAGQKKAEMIMSGTPVRSLGVPYDSYHSDSLSLHSGPGGFTPEQQAQILTDGKHPTCITAKDWPAFYAPKNERTAVDGVESYSTGSSRKDITLTFKDWDSNFAFTDWLISMLAARDVAALKEPSSDRINPSDTGKSYIGREFGKQRSAFELLERLEPHLDALVCHASTTEYEPNKLVKEVRDLLGVPPVQQPAPVAGELNHDRIRQIFLANGFTIKEGQTDLKDYVYKAADALLSAAKKGTP